MELVSTRNNSHKVSFRTAVLECIPSDGGLYVPSTEEDLRPWIMYMDETTSFASIAGSLTSALLKEEFSPVVSERMAGSAFSDFSPRLNQLDDNLFNLELYHGPTGSHKDFALLWFASVLEHMLTIEDRTATVLAATAGMTGRSMAAAFAGKKRLKMILVYERGTALGLDPACLARNGGNILPLEIDGSLQDAQQLVRSIYSDPVLVRQYGLTLANTMNIGRLLPQVFFYVFAFSRMRKKIRGDIFYAVPSGNYGNLVAGLYAWKFSLPVNGFITDATPSLSCDVSGHCHCLDSIVPLMERGPADPASPSNMERLEQVFAVSPAMLRGLVFPAEVHRTGVTDLMFRAYKKYGLMLDSASALAYGAIEQVKDRIESDEGTVVLVSKDHPSFEAERIRTSCGLGSSFTGLKSPLLEPVEQVKRYPVDRRVIEKIIREFH